MRIPVSYGEARRRFKHGVAAQAYIQLVQLLAQLGLVPLYVTAWGAHDYGVWILISSIPTVLSVSDLMLGSVAGSEMTMLMARDDRSRTKAVFDACWVFITTLSVLCAVVATLALATLTNILPKAATQSPYVVLAATILLVITAALSQQGSMLDAAFRSLGAFATGSALLCTIRLVEVIVVGASLFQGASFVVVAASMLLVKFLGLLLIYLVLLKRAPWLVSVPRRVDLSEAKRLIGSAIGMLMFTLSNIVNLQGAVWIVGVTVGPSMAAAYSTMRTITRLVTQSSGMLSTAMWPELSIAYGSSNLSLVKNLQARLFRLGLGAAVSLAILLAVMWYPLYVMWTKGALATDGTLFNVLLLSAVVAAACSLTYVVSIANNSHSSLAWRMIGVSILVLVLSFVASRSYGALGVAIPALFGDVVLLGFAFKSARSQTGLTFRQMFQVRSST